MTKEELKEMMIKAGVEESDIVEKDIERVTEIINQSGSPNEAIKKISQAYPQVSEESLKEDTKDLLSTLKAGDVTAVQELSDADLEAVAGGSFGSWMKDNWGYVVGTVAVLGVLSLTGVYVYKKRKAILAAEEQAGVEKGVIEGTKFGKINALQKTLDQRKLGDLMENIIIN